jgi:predicted molibdopterin-dependent oxidoreductase YjgC
MPLPDRPDFKDWLERFEARHARIHAGGPQAPDGSCDGCGVPLSERVSTTGLCLVCLAEAYGREQAATAERIAGALRVALATDDGTPIEAIRDAVDDVLDQHERDASRRCGEESG